MLHGDGEFAVGFYGVFARLWDMSLDAMISLSELQDCWILTLMFTMKDMRRWSMHTHQEYEDCSEGWNYYIG
jgi:hypothetical protein